MKSTAAFLTCMVAVATAAPAPESGFPADAVVNGKTFRLHQAHNHRFKARDAVHEFYTVHAKYGKDLPDALKSAILRNPGLNSKFSILTDGKPNYTLHA